MKWVRDPSARIPDLDAYLALTLVWSTMTCSHQVKRASRSFSPGLLPPAGSQLLKDT